jgi:hypothetical protein
MTVKDKHANLVVESGVEERFQFQYNQNQLLSLLPLHQSLVAVKKNVGVDIRVEETKAIIMKE